MKNHKLILFLLVLFGSILPGCGGENPTPNQTDAPDETIAESSPEITAEPGPETTLSEVGPWVLIKGENGLWAANPDGSGLSFIYQVEPEQLAIGGRYAAFIEESPGYYGNGLALKVFSFPDGKVETITELFSESTELQPGDADLGGRIAIRTAVQMDNLVWSPDGTRLAFVSAHEGDSADLYVYSPEDGSLTRLSEVPSQVYRVTWSPDGKHIVLISAKLFGTGAGYDLDSAWVVCADGSCFRTLFEPWGGDEIPLGWIANDTLVLYTFSAREGFTNLRSVNIETGEENILWAHSFEEAALDPNSGTAVVIVSDLIARADPEIEAGLYFVHANGETELVPLSDFFSEEFRAHVSWHEEASLFLVELSSEFLSLSPSGEIELIVPRIIKNPQPVPSPNGDVWVWYDDGMLVLNGPDIEIQLLFPSSSHPIWGQDGSTVLFVHEGQLVVGSLDDMSTTAVGNGLIGGLRWMGLTP
jgi:hypothetical protein